MNQGCSRKMRTGIRKINVELRFPKWKQGFALKHIPRQDEVDCNNGRKTGVRGRPSCGTAPNMAKFASSCRRRQQHGWQSQGRMNIARDKPDQPLKRIHLEFDTKLATVADRARVER